MPARTAVPPTRSVWLASGKPAPGSHKGFQNPQPAFSPLPDRAAHKALPQSQSRPRPPGSRSNGTAYPPSSWDSCHHGKGSTPCRSGSPGCRTFPPPALPLHFPLLLQIHSYRPFPEIKKHLPFPQRKANASNLHIFFCCYPYVPALHALPVHPVSFYFPPCEPVLHGFPCLLFNLLLVCTAHLRLLERRLDFP